MPSNINPANPVYGRPTTQSVRNNFQYAHDEITALQAYQAAVGNGPFALKAGDTFTGPVLLGHTPPTVANEAASKSYVDGRAGTMQSLTAGTGLTGGTITTTGTIAVNFGTVVGTVTQGNDARFSTIPAPANAAPPMDGAAAIGSSANYARQDHRHASDSSKVNKAGDTISGTLVVGDLISNGNLNTTGNCYLQSTLGIQYAGSNWIRFGWNGNLNVYIDGGYNWDVASTNWVNGNFATFGWVQNNYWSPGYIDGNFQRNGSHYIPNQNVDSGASVYFNGMTCQRLGTNDTFPNHSWTFWQAGNNAYIRLDATWDYYAPYSGSSDGRLKRDIQPTEVNSLDILNKFELVKFKWLDSPYVTPAKKESLIGFTTQQLKEVFEDTINPDPEDIPPYVDGDGKSTGGVFHQSVNTNVMLALLIGGMQQLTQRLEQVESKL